jgi:hypothetical protein
MAAEIGCDIGSVKRAVKRLRREGLITTEEEIQSGRRHLVYRVPLVDQWDESARGTRARNKEFDRLRDRPLPGGTAATPAVADSPAVGGANATQTGEKNKEKKQDTEHGRNVPGIVPARVEGAGPRVRPAGVDVAESSGMTPATVTNSTASKTAKQLSELGDRYAALLNRATEDDFEVIKRHFAMIEDLISENPVSPDRLFGDPKAAAAWLARELGGRGGSER